MKTIDFDKKIEEVQKGLVDSFPKAAMPPKTVVVNEQRLKLSLKIIAGELLKDPVIVAMMTLRNEPSPKNMEVFLATVKTYIDYATAVRYREMLDGSFMLKETPNDPVV